MEHRFDSLARTVSGRLSRRETLWRLGGYAAFAVLGFFRPASAGQQPQPCGACCALACANLDPPPRGMEMALCIQECHNTGKIGLLEPCTDVCPG